MLRRIPLSRRVGSAGFEVNEEKYLTDHRSSKFTIFSVPQKMPIPLCGIWHTSLSTETCLKHFLRLEQCSDLMCYLQIQENAACVKGLHLSRRKDTEMGVRRLMEEIKRTQAKD